MTARTPPAHFPHLVVSSTAVSRASRVGGSYSLNSCAKAFIRRSKFSLSFRSDGDWRRTSSLSTIGSSEVEGVRHVHDPARDAGAEALAQLRRREGVRRQGRRPHVTAVVEATVPLLVEPVRQLHPLDVVDEQHGGLWLLPELPIFRHDLVEIPALDRGPYVVRDLRAIGDDEVQRGVVRELHAERAR